MGDFGEFLPIITSKPGLIDRIHECIANTVDSQNSILEADASLLVGPDDPRLSITTLAQYRSGEGDAYERIPYSLNFDMLLNHGVLTNKDCWAMRAAYPDVKELLKMEVPELTPQQLLSALVDFVPHAIRVVTVVWCEGKILMRLKNPGTVAKPASVIEFPQATMLGHDATFDDAALVIAKSAFSPIIKPHWDVQLTNHWKVITPDRPEILLRRYADFIGDPKIFFGPWAEEQYMPYVWASPESVFDASCGENSALIAEIREADELYRSKGRELITEIDVDESCDTCGSTLKASSRKLPIKSSLIVSDDLQVDAGCLSIMESMHF